MRALVPALFCIALAACGGPGRAANEAEGGTAMDSATIAKLNLTSDSFRDGEAIPAQFTCDGGNRSPALSWGEPPQGTKSFALVVDDPDAPSGTFRHWGAYDITAAVRSIAAGQSVGSQAINDKGTPGYTGPCPPNGHGVHHYHFKLFALDTDRLDVGAEPRIADIEKAAKQHALGRAELIGTYERR
jgi:Raf kinase inhibitor-like YbhB/YbcL family protein